jgi:hypothetical protein
MQRQVTSLEASKAGSNINIHLGIRGFCTPSSQTTLFIPTLPILLVDSSLELYLQATYIDPILFNNIHQILVIINIRNYYKEGDSPQKKYPQLKAS